MNAEWLFVGAVAVAIFGCARAPSEFTVDYYRDHADERRARLAQCANDPGALREDALCVNAREAESLESVGGLRRLPPMGLVEAERAAKEPQQRDRD